jgi:hypothetical protein
MSKSQSRCPRIGVRHSSALGVEHIIGEKKNRPGEKEIIFREKTAKNPDRGK